MKRAEQNYSFTDTTSLGAQRKAARQKAIFDHLLPKLAETSSVVEIGPGRGEFARECREKRLDYIGIEPSDRLAAELRDAGFKVINQTVPPLPLADASSDLLFSHDFIEHLADYREVMAFLAESMRILKPGGHLCVIAPNYETLKTVFYLHEYQHSFIVTKYRLRAMLEDSGFEVVESRNYLLILRKDLNWLDRIIAYLVLPFAVSTIGQGLLRTLTSERFAFRVNKNIYDHVAIVGRKPAIEAKELSAVGVVSLNPTQDATNSTAVATRRRHPVGLYSRVLKNALAAFLFIGLGGTATAAYAQTAAIGEPSLAAPDICLEIALPRHLNQTINHL